LQIGPFDKDRYLAQDLEPQRQAAVQLSVNHERLWQEELAQQKAEQEAKARIDWIHQDIDNRQRMRLYAEDVKFRFCCPSQSRLHTMDGRASRGAVGLSGVPKLC
jgi:hypothetical protein